MSSYFKKWDNNKNDISQNIHESVKSFILDTINKHTSENGTTRDKTNICTDVRKKMIEFYGIDWACFFSHYYTFTASWDYTFTFDFTKDDGDKMVFYKE